MAPLNAKDLFDKYQSGQCSPEEQAVVENWLTFGEATSLDLSEAELDADLAALRQRLLGRTTRRSKLWPRVAAVSMVWKIAAAVAVITLGVWFYYASSISGSSSRGTEGSLVYGTDIAPGKNTATLTLADGKTFNLSDAKTGVIINKSGLKYNDQSEIASSLRFPRNDEEAIMLTASTPRGGTYQVTLPDGTRVWLNADSKIKFPSQFIGAQRKIILFGEAYFEVAKNKAKPFIVESPGQEVTVLGTHFNINSYADEGNTKTTLLEGSVSVSNVPRLRSTSSRGTEGTPGHATSRDPSMLRDDGKMPESIILKPNQQAVLMANNKITVKQIDPSEAVAWKEGVFIFDSTPLDQIMRQVARWYNIEVIYDNPELKGELMGGSVSRYDQVSRILKTLENTGAVKFRIEEGKVYVAK